MAKQEGRNIVLLSDGTGNAAGKLFKTNVWRTYQALDLSSVRQVAFYDDGVGNSPIKPLAILGGAFGWGLKRNVLALYTFLCRNYVAETGEREADRIYGFGFSRGAFTMRVLIKFVLSQGLVTKFNSSDDLHQKALWLYREFRKDHNTRLRLEVAARWLRDWALWPWRPESIDVVHVPKIQFLGLWDTVDAYGLPVEELKRGIDRYLWPLALEDRVLDTRIERARHALAIDDKRTTFHPLLWDESSVGEEHAPQHTADERLTQVWFAGAHANVGGGYPDDGLSSVPLRWMVRQAKTSGLAFNPTALKEIEENFAPFGRLYDSRGGAGAYYRYGPRRLDPPRDKQGACIPHPKIHETVLLRMAAGTDAYAPLSLPNDLRIVVDSSASDASKPIKAGQPDAPPPDIVSFETYLSRTSTRQTELATAQTDDQRDSGWRLEKPDKDTLDLIWATVWWRRTAYFATLAATALLVAYPFLPDGPTVAPRGLRELAEGIAPVTNSIVELVGAFLPTFAKSWLDVFKTNPWMVSTLIAWLAVCIAWGSLIDRRIHDRALAAWNTKWRGDRAEWLRSRLRQRRFFNVILLVVAAIAAGSAYYAAMNPDTSACATHPANSDKYFMCLLFAVAPNLTFYGPIAIVAGAVAIGNVVWSYVLWRIINEAETGQKERPGFALRLAIRARGSERWGATQRWLSANGIPALFAILVVLFVFYSTNRLAFVMAQSAGFVCAQQETEFVPEGTKKTITVSSRGLCNATGVRLLSGERYQITVETGEGWGDPILTPRMVFGAQGYTRPISEAPHLILALPMRRVLNADWFALTAKIGASGDEQYMLQDSGVIEPKRSGDLYLFVNDAVIAFPFLADAFYRNNRGTAEITIENITSPPPP